MNSSPDERAAYRDKMTEGYIRPFIFSRTTLEDAKETNPVLHKGVLVAEVKSYVDWSNPKWKMGDGKTRYMDLPYCSGPPSVVISTVYPILKER